MRVVGFYAICLLIVLNTVPLDGSQSTRSSWKAATPRVPEFKVPGTREAWSRRRAEIQAKLWELLGALPARPTVPAVSTLSREDYGEFVLEKFQFQNGADASVPGYLLLPKGVSGKVPAILYCHWHGGEYDKGKVELFERGHTPEEPGPAFVRRGFAVLAIDAYGFGERNGQGPGSAEKGSAGELTASKYNLWFGRTLWGMMLRDDLMALDYLASRPEVDAERMGVTGMSMGATRSWWLMALDERIKAGVAVACLTRYQNLISREGLENHGIYYYVPGILNHFDMEAVVALAAPRPLLLMNGDQDAGSPVEGIREIASRVKPAYDLYGASENFRNDVYEGAGHVYLPEMWRQALAWFEKRLKRESSPAAGRPLICKLGTIDCDLVETTPIVFQGKPYRFEWVRTSYRKNELRKDHFRLVEHDSGKTTPPFALGYQFGSAYVENGTVYVTGTFKSKRGDQIRMFSSRDLRRWESWIVFDQPGFGIFNTSLCRAGQEYVLMFEIDRPADQAGVPFTARFLKSRDLRAWALAPPECNYAKDRYTAPHCLRYLDGWVYDFYLEAHEGYEMRVVRSRDLVDWESSPLNPVLRASPEDRLVANERLTEEERRRIATARNINNSDIDFCEYEGKLIINYSWGNQQGIEFLAEAVYDGAEADFLRAWFPADKPPK